MNLAALRNDLTSIRGGLYRRYVLKDICGIPAADHRGDFELEQWQVAAIWLAIFLHRLPALAETAAMLILEEIRPRLREFITEPGTGLQLVLVDGEYATWRGYGAYLRLEDGERVECVPAVPLVSFSVNLGELIRRGKQVAAKSNRGEVTDDGHGLGTGEVPGSVD